MRTVEDVHYSVATRLAVKTSVPRLEALPSIYTRVNLTLVRANARALLGRALWCEITPPPHLHGVQDVGRAESTLRALGGM